MMWWPDGAMSGWGWLAMTISFVLFWGVVVLGGVLAVRALNRSAGQSTAPERPSPEQLLAERFARGEIDEEEYRQRRAALASSGFVTRA